MNYAVEMISPSGSVWRVATFAVYADALQMAVDLRPCVDGKKYVAVGTRSL